MKTINDLIEIEKILGIVKSKIEAHKDFKKEYDKQLAFDFSLFNFFDLGENKVSQILAYFLDEKQNHGQGNLFLKEFVNQFYSKEIDTTNSINICEKIIDKNRRIDIYIEIEDLIIAIENKIWADDQCNQLEDYAVYLEKKSKGSFLLLYLNPYGSEPTSKSISDDFKKKLIKNKQFKVVSYQHDIIPLINKWLVICEADNVSYFIKEFKKYLEIKFFGNNTLNMNRKLREIIYQNKEEVESLIQEYKNIKNDIITKLNAVGERSTIKIQNNNDKKGELFTWERKRIYHYIISKGNNSVCIEYKQEGISLFLGCYFKKGTDDKFKKYVENTPELKKILEFKDYNDKSENELIKLFMTEVKTVNGIFDKFEEHEEE